ncbi:MAG: HEAT repeat domain-containing protein [Myxococcales bacterium]|nr:HEAT repeat domain-containing protein [Myxococcales bacterium]
MGALRRALSRAAPALLLVSACSSEPASPAAFPVRLDRVWQRADEVPDGRELDMPRVREGMLPLLARVPALAPATEEESVDALGMQVWFSEHDAGDPLLSTQSARDLLLVVELEAPPALRRTIGESRVSARVLLERDPGPGLPALEDDVLLAAQRAFEVVGARLALARGDAGVVEQLLEDEDPELLLLALEWIRDRRPEIHTDAVVKLLAHPDPRVSRLAVESLGVVGESRHAREIVKHMQLGDPDHTREVYRTLAVLGGEEAIRFLEFAADNEDDPVLRREAERAYLAARQVSEPASYEDARVPKRFARGHRQ